MCVILNVTRKRTNYSLSMNQSNDQVIHLNQQVASNNITNFTDEWLALLLRTTEVPGLCLGLKAGYTDRLFRNFPQYLQVNIEIVPKIKPRPLPPTFIAIHY